MMDEPARHRIVLVTGLSGAGKLSILRCLEDIGFEATDNPPMALVEQMVSDDPGGQMHKVAVGLDVRSRGFNAEGLVQALDRLYRQRKIDLAHARVMRTWGERGVAPSTSIASQAADARLWRDAMRLLDAPLRAKGIIAAGSDNVVRLHTAGSAR